jgi:signal transduction histidine kinase
VPTAASASAPQKPRTTLRTKLSRLTNRVLLFSMVAIIMVQVAAGIWDYFQRIRQLRADVSNNLISKGTVLIANNGVALRGMAVDNAFLSIKELVATTVREDPDVVYGIYMDNERLPWALVMPGHTEGIDSAAPLSDSMSVWAHRLAQVGVKYCTIAGKSTIIEFAAPVMAEGQRMGTIRYGMSTMGIDKIAASIKGQALRESLLHPLFFLVMGLLIYLFVSRLSRQQADAITKPLHELTNAATTIAAGNYAVPVTTKSDDEAGTLADHFETMRKTVYAYTTNLEQMVSRRTEQLAKKNQELQEFSYVASHDLQEPLRKIVVFGDRIKDKTAGQLGEQVTDYFSRMMNAARRMQGLIDGLLAYSRVSTKVNPFVPTDLGAVVRDVIADLEIRISETKGTVEVGPMVTIDADQLQMRQLLQNLIGNSLKYHKKDVQPVVKVHSRVLPDAAAPAGMPGPAAEIIVEDNGIGIGKEYFEKIFVVFQRLHSRGSEYEGSGIGLSVVKKIAERHGGDIRVESEENAWTRFIVILPARQTEKPA